MSALGQKRTLPCLFDHLVRAREKRRWNFEAEPLGRLLIDRQIKFGWHLDRKIGLLGATEDLVRVPCEGSI